MSIQEMLSTISERLQKTATVTTVYGDPITAEGKTIIPVARVRYGFGGGGGSQGADSPEGNTPSGAEGRGGGGGVEVSPVGFIEITADESRYVSFEERKRIIRAVFVGALLGIFLLRRRRRG